MYAFGKRMSRANGAFARPRPISPQGGHALFIVNDEAAPRLIRVDGTRLGQDNRDIETGALNHSVAAIGGLTAAHNGELRNASAAAFEEAIYD